MPNDKKKKLHKLSDIDVETVGLVTFGANQERFFLLKSHNEQEDTMPEDVVNQEVQTDETFWEKLGKVFRGELEAVAKGAEETETETDPNAENEEDKIAKMNDQMAELSKANEALIERLEKAEKKAAEEAEKRELQEYVEKATVLDKIPAKAEELGAHLREVYKSDEERGEYFFTLLKAVNEQLGDSAIFEETGTSEGDETPPVGEKLSDLVAKGASPEDVRKAMLAMGEKDAWAEIDEQRKKIKE